MSPQTRCHCRSCTIRSLMGPAVVITLGVLFLFHEAHGGRFYFGNTWPVLLLVLGAIQIAASFAPRDGHIEVPPAGNVPPNLPPPPVTVPPAASNQPPFSGQGQ